MKPLRELGVDGLEHDGPGAVREEHGHVPAPIGVLEHRRQPLGADHEHLPVGADPDERVGHRQRVHEPGASLLEVQDRRGREAELRGHDGPGVRVRVLGDGRGDDDEVDVVDLESRVLEGHLDRLAPKIGGREVRVDLPVDTAIVDLLQIRGLVGRLREPLQESVRARQHPALLDPGALGDPRVGGGEAAREQVVVHHAVGHRHPGARRSSPCAWLPFAVGCYRRRQPTTRSQKLSRIGNPFVAVGIPPGREPPVRTVYAPVNRGGRFSKNARSPSRWSAAAIISPCVRASQWRAD